MIGKTSVSIRLLTSVGILFLAVYFCLAVWYRGVAESRDAAQMEIHAVVIAHDLWNLNASGMTAYLTLAARTEHYKGLEIVTNDGESFLKIECSALSGVDRFLEGLGIIYSREFSLPVTYEEEQIGSLRGVRYIRYVYPLFFIFLIQVFLVLTLLFIFSLVFNRRLLERQVRERTRRYQELVDLLPEMVLETDAEGVVTFANEKARQRFGLTALDRTKPDCRDYILEENGMPIEHAFYLHAEEHELETKEYRARRSDGGLFPVIVRSAPIYSEGKSAGARIVIVDITEKSALEEQLNRDRKMKSIGMMAGGVAHDLNNILSGIINYPELIRQELPQDSRLIRLVDPMKEAGMRAAAVVADLLTVARGVAAPRESVNLNSIINEYTASPEFEKLSSLYPEISYRLSLCPDIRNISCSVIHVRKCLMNLVTNASEAVESNGQVVIQTGNETITDPLTTGHGTIKAGSYVILSVCDSGSGISPHELSRIFEPFYSKKELGRSGTGLGLAVVWNTIQDHEGGISVSSDAEGTCFTLYFPCSGERVRDTDYTGDAGALKGHGESILVVDDELQQRDIATQLLESLGYQVESVASGDAALDYVRGRKVDLVLLDMILGAGINGRRTYEEILRQYPGQKAVIMSGYSDSEDVKMTLRMGAGGFLNKPYTKEQLAAAVGRELERDRTDLQ